MFMDTKWRCDANNGFKCSYLGFYLTFPLWLFCYVLVWLCVSLLYNVQYTLLLSSSVSLSLPRSFSPHDFWLNRPKTLIHQARLTCCKHLVQIWLSRRKSNIWLLQKDEITVIALENAKENEKKSHQWKGKA